MATITDLTFRNMREQNVARAQRWHPNFPHDDEWNGADWSNAMCGEAGEAANIVKHLRRLETGHAGHRGDESTLRDELALELADLILYADLLAAKYNINLGISVAYKFNVVSRRQDFPERLP
jgi:NTP pyrophosphatase (non-canonical NTP hydrolase)